MGSSTESLRYRIVVRGRLSERFLEAFDGVAVVAGEGRTTLIASFTDVTQLYGLLDWLRDFGIELVSVDAR